MTPFPKRAFALSEKKTSPKAFYSFVVAEQTLIVNTLNYCRFPLSNDRANCAG